MKNQLIKSEKQLKADVKKFGLSSISKAKGAIEDSILCGLALLKLKEITPHGQWESTFKSAIDGVFGMRHGQKLMQIADKKDLLLIAPKDAVLTINDAIEFVSKATPEQLEKAEKLKLELEEKARIAEEEKQRKAAELEAKRQEVEILKHVEVKQHEIIEGEFTEVKSQSGGTNPCHEEEPAKPDIDENPADYMQSIIDELNEQLQEVLADNESMAKVFDANDQLAEALTELKKAKETIRVLEDRLRGLQNERNAAIKSAKYWKSLAEKNEKLEKKAVGIKEY